MKKLLIVLLLSLPIFAYDLQQKSGLVEAHTEQLMDSNINITNNNLHAQLKIEDKQITTLSGKFWVDVVAFESEKEDRDKNMYKSIGASEFKMATYTISNIMMSDADGGYIINGKLNFHGQERELRAEGKIFFKDDILTIDMTSVIYMSEYGVEMPCMIFMCVRDQIDLTIKATFK